MPSILSIGIGGSKVKCLFSGAVEMGRGHGICWSPRKPHVHRKPSLAL